MTDHTPSRPIRNLLSPLFLKLTLAFALVAILSMAASAAFIRLQAQGDFNRYVRDRAGSEFGARLADYYAAHQGWQGVATVFSSPAPPPAERPPRWLYTVVDSAHDVVYGIGLYTVGEPVQQDVLSQATPITSSGEVVGWLLIAPAQIPAGSQTPETEFASRLTEGVLTSVLIALGFSVVIGALSARTLSWPIRELTAAIRRVAGGELGYQVRITTRDELGELGRSFNQMSADLAEATNLRRQMTADIAHELRTPLSVILGYAEALNEGKLPGSPGVFESLHVEARHLQRLIDDLRLLSLADAGELTLTQERTAPQALLERARFAFTAQAEQRHIQMRLTPAADLPKIEVDPDRMAQVLGNLIQNALRYTAPGDEIVLSAAHVKGAIELRVQDNGAGIDEKDLPHIFDRFYRGDEARYAEDNESGLGLAIARSIVEAHQGSIDVESSPGKGSTFMIRLPITQPAT